jgi:parallel beta-helix repeat protein
VSVTANWGTLDIESTKITSWDAAVGGPDTEFQTFGRAFVRVRSSLDADGVTALESRMDIVDSEVSFLGYDASESYGLAWKVAGVHPDPAKSIFDYVNVYGDIINTHIHDNFWAVYTFGAYGSQWLNNEIDHNAGYGFDPHDDSDNLRIEGNNVHHNGFIGRGHHGIIASRRCDHLVIRNNHSWANAGNGIMLHRHSSDNVVENNLSELNSDSGIAIFDADRNLIRNNVVLSNSNAGMRFSVGAADNFIEQNEVGYSGKNGFYLYQGDDLAEPDDADPTVTARPQRNTFTNNVVHHSVAEAVNLGDSDDNTFASNTFTADNGQGSAGLPPGTMVLGFENSANTMLAGNSLPANAVVRLDGATTNATTMSLKSQPFVQVMLDAYSAATFDDDSGAIFDTDQGDLATTVNPSGSSLSITLAAIGAQTITATITVVTRNFLVVPDGGAILINPALWELSGDRKKQWTTQPVDSSGTPSPQAVSVTASIHYSVGDLSPNTSYLVLKDGQPLLPVTSDATGHVSFADVPGTANPIQYAIAPNTQPPPLPTVTVAATDASATESGPTTGTFTISRTGGTTSSLTVNYSLSGTAANGSDYQSLSGTASIPVGAAWATVTVTPIDDTLVEGNETVTLTVSASPAHTVGSPSSATVTITDNDQTARATVTVVASDSSASEGGPGTGTFSISRIGGGSSALTVNYSLGGTASNGTDYRSLPGSATIASGATSATVTVTPIDDTAVEGNETVVLTISANTAYTVGSPNSATVTIADNDQSPPPTPTVTVAATDTNAAEKGTDPGTFVISRTGDAGSSLTVSYSLGGTAANSIDYQTLPGVVTIPAGASAVAVIVRPIDDRTVESNETVILTLSASAAYIVGSPNTATITIADNDKAGTVIAVGSSLAAGSVVAMGSILDGTSILTATTLVIATSLDGTATLATGSIIAAGSTLAAGSELATGTTVMGSTSVAGTTQLSGITMVGLGSTLAAGSVIAAGSVLNGTAVTTATTLTTTTTVWGGGILAAGSTLAVGSTLAAGTLVL